MAFQNASTTCPETNVAPASENVPETRDQSQKSRHRFGAIQQSIVHVNVDHTRAALDLITSDLDRFFEFFFADQASEFTRTGNVRPLSDHQEIRILAHRQRARSG